MFYLPDSYQIRSGPGVSGVRFQNLTPVMPYMKLHGMTIDELWMRLALLFMEKIIERIPKFHIRHLSSLSFF